MYDLVIIGGGPAGMSAAIYASRASMNFCLIDKGIPGGAIVTSDCVDNYPGMPDVSGAELATRFAQHISGLGIEPVCDEITSLDLFDDRILIHGLYGDYETRFLLVNTGCHPRRLEVKGEKELIGKGISFCAACDGAFFRDKTVAVVGGGDTAACDAILLSRIASHVELIVRGDQMRSARRYQEKINTLKNITVHYDCEVTEIKGEGRVDSIVVKTRDGSREMKVSGVFEAVGIEPNNSLIRGKVDTDRNGFVLTDSFMRSSCHRIYVCGDLRNTPLRQVVTAVSDGAVAVTHIAGLL